MNFLQFVRIDELQMRKHEVYIFADEVCSFFMSKFLEDIGESLIIFFQCLGHLIATLFVLDANEKVKIHLTLEWKRNHDLFESAVLLGDCFSLWHCYSLVKAENCKELNNIINSTEFYCLIDHRSHLMEANLW